MIYGANLGAINHMAGIMLQNTEPGAKFRFVQIGGGTANFTALTGAQTAATVLSGAEVLNFTKLPDGSDNPEAEIKALAYTGAERLEKLPDLPTVKELGRDMEFCIDSWWFAPKGTPPEAVEGMAAALEAASGTDQITSFYDSKAFAPVFLKGEELQQSLTRHLDPHRTRRPTSRPKVVRRGCNLHLGYLIVGLGRPCLIVGVPGQGERAPSTLAVPAWRGRVGV